MDSFYARLQQTVESFPEKMAYSAPDLQITYPQLLHMAQAVGTCIAQRVPFQHAVAVLMDARSALCVPVMLGTLFAGCFYSPLDPNLPEERLNIILNNYQPALIVADDKATEKAAAIYPNSIILSASEVLATVPDVALIEERGEKVCEKDYATVMYTSGSTGVPKGVSQTRQALEVWADNCINRFGITKDTILASQAPWYYANSLLELYVPFIQGASVVMVPPTFLTFPKKFITYLQEQHITELAMTPSSYVAITSSGILSHNCLPEMSIMIMAGEVMPKEALRQWMDAAPNARFFNFYGSTEALDVAADEVTSLDWEGVLPVGRLFSQVYLRLVREDGTEAAVNETGEMYLSGPMITVGYYRDPERTSASLVPDPLGKDDKLWYRTGDYAQLDENGSLFVVGRKDSMIKHHGYRMELGEVETAIRTVPGCMEVCCLYHAETDEIWCFATGNVTKSDIQSHLKTRLARYMLPNQYMCLEKMPHNTSMKIDRVALRKMMNDSYAES